MATILTPDVLKSMFNGNKLHQAYYESVSLYVKLRIHANGECPIHLIKNSRPNESDEVRTYRESIYETETQNPVERVLGLLEKIRRSPDWMIRFDNDNPPIINSEETLKCYLMENYPIYQNFEIWLYEEALKTAALDANAVVVILPKDFNIQPTEYIKPYAQIFNSKQVLEYVADDYVVVKTDELSSLLSAESQQKRLANANNVITQLQQNGLSGISEVNRILQEPFQKGQVYLVVNTLYYEKWEETEDGKYQLTTRLMHNLGQLPAFQMPGKFHKRIGQNIIKKTPLHPMVPHLNKAARQSNDLDAAVIMHLYPEKWRISNTPCNDCNGTGKMLGSVRGTCKKCDGKGITTGKSPFNEVIVKPASIGDQQVPTPPIGYVAKDPEIIKVQNEMVEQHIYRALASVNMEHLAETPLNQSGTAKQLDRDSLNNIIYLFAEYLVQIANNSIYWINELRYKSVIVSNDDRVKLLPVIPVPEKFDIIDTSFLISEYQTAKTAGLNSIILAEMQKDIAEKKFSANPSVSSFVATVMECDPFSDKTIEEKSLLESQGLATKEDVVLSNYISDFVRQAMDENADFITFNISKKREILKKYAIAKVGELDTAKTISQDIFPPSNNPTPNPIPSGI
jgi:hypothetical protein